VALSLLKVILVTSDPFRPSGIYPPVNLRAEMPYREDSSTGGAQVDVEGEGVEVFDGGGGGERRSVLRGEGKREDKRMRRRNRQSSGYVIPHQARLMLPSRPCLQAPLRVPRRRRPMLGCETQARNDFNMSPLLVQEHRSHLPPLRTLPEIDIASHPSSTTSYYPSLASPQFDLCPTLLCPLPSGTQLTVHSSALSDTVCD